MNRISSDRWAVLSPLFDEALELSEPERSAWLEAQRQTDPGLAAALEELLRHEAQLDSEDFLGADARPGLPSQAVSLAGTQLGPWKLERPLGQGGMGTVWLARRADGRFEGQAAVKLLKLALLSATGQERFRREGSVLARLTHPGIARLLDAGVSGAGQPYLVLEYVDGQPIDAYVKERQLPQAALLQLFQQVLAAVGHAHANLVVHRDLKPSNILVTGDGRVKLLDFGIAKLLDVESGDVLTSEGSRALTPRYAAPEQVRGEPLSTATDVYALGVLLYLLLSGRHPTAPERSTPAQSVTNLLRVEPARLGLGDLDTILAKALRKEPTERYQTVAAFGDDLERYLQQEPVSVRADSLAYRMGKFVRRNRGAVAAAALITLGLTLATLFSVLQMREARVQRDAAVRAARRADAQVEFQDLLLSEIGDQPITMRQALDTARILLNQQAAGDPRLRTALLLQLVGNYQEVADIQVRDTLLAQAESLALAGGDTVQLAQVRCDRVALLRKQGRYPEAWQAWSGAESLALATGDPSVLAECLNIKAQLAVENHLNAEGLVAARRAVAIRDSLGTTGGKDYLDMLDNLAYALDGVGASREAEAVERHEIAAMDSSGRGGTLDAAIMWHNHALTLLNLGESAEAERLLHRAQERYGRRDRSGRVDWNGAIHYAEAALIQGHADSALKYFDLVVTQAIAEKVLYWEGRGLFGAARAEVVLGRLPEARRARARVERIDSLIPDLHDTDDQIPDARVLGGIISLAASDAAAAKPQLLAALTSNGYFAGKDRKRLRPVVLLLAECALALGQTAEAVDYARQARAIAMVDSLAERESALVGEAALLEGRALLAQGDTVQARAQLATAVAALRHGAGADHPRTRAAQALADSLSTQDAPLTKH
jgi:serine/threonine-protein kinase